MKVCQTSEIFTFQKTLILQLQVTLELSQFQEILSIYTDFLFLFAEYPYLFKFLKKEPNSLQGKNALFKNNFITQDPARDGGNWYAYCSNNPLRYTDPTGLFDWDTSTIESGDTLTKIKNEFNQIYETNYNVDEVAQACGIENKNLIYANDKLDFSSILPEWHVEGRGSGTGGWVGALFVKFGAEADLSGYTMDFTINETGETFSEKYYSLAKTGKALKVGYGIYTIDIEASATFKGKRPTPEEIKDSFAGTSKNIGFSFIFAGITGSESGNWLVNTGGLSFGGGLPFSVGSEDSFTWRRGK